MHAMPMPAASWPAAAAAYLAMWTPMMGAMMLPSLVPMLLRSRAARLSGLTMVVCAGYLVVWTVIGVGVFSLSPALAGAEGRLPALAGAVVLLGGALQLSSWKVRHLACCRAALAPGHMPATDVRSAWQRGIRLGGHCAASCAGLTAALLAAGMMDPRAMAAVTAAITAAITAERLAPRGERVARAVGVVVVCVGSVLLMGAVRAG